MKDRLADQWHYGKVISDEELIETAARLAELPDVVGVVLGGSRARGEHTEQSDVDLGIYYSSFLDTDRIAALAREVGGPASEVTGLGGWGPWVDGGGWLTIGGTAVDWIYRDLGRVEEAWDLASQGQVEFHRQLGHPIGVPEFAYVGELALGRILADPAGELTSIKERVAVYPTALKYSLVDSLSDADFYIGLARKAVLRADATYIAGCLFSAFLVAAHALHGVAGRWLINEKGAIASAGRLAASPPHFDNRVSGVMGELGSTSATLQASIDEAGEILAEVRKACAATQ